MMRSLPIATLTVALAVLVGCGADEEATPTTGNGANAAGEGQTGQAESRGSGATKKPFRSVEAAVRFAQTKVDVPVSVPPELQDAGKTIVRAGPDRSAQLDLFGPDGTLVTLRYGEGVGFDGCETPEFEQVLVADAPALLAVHQTPEGAPLVELIWPADAQRRTGHFGLSGQLSKARALELAKGIDTAGVEGVGKRTPEC